MEAIPLSETSAASCAKALTFTWISPFGVPKTITSHHGPQSTSSLWLQLCEMLNISHKQTTADHPKSNSSAERLHCTLKDALHARAATATWSEELPFVLLGLRAQPREDNGLVKVRCIFVQGFSNIRTPKYRLPRIFSLVCKYVLQYMRLFLPNQL
jgi:hypothetical protein